MARSDRHVRARTTALTGAVLMLTLPACMSPEEPAGTAVEHSAPGEASLRSDCDDVRIDTWFGPARTRFEARVSCEALLADDCAALGCAADLDTIDVHGYGGETDTNYYCQGDTADFDAELPKYLAACRAPGDAPTEGGPSI